MEGSVVRADLHCRHGHLTADDGAGVEVVLAGALAQRVHVHLAPCIAGEGEGTALVEQRLEAQLVLRSVLQGRRTGLHGGDSLDICGGPPDSKLSEQPAPSPPRPTHEGWQAVALTA